MFGDLFNEFVGGAQSFQNDQGFQLHGCIFDVGHNDQDGVQEVFNGGGGGGGSTATVGVDFGADTSSEGNVELNAVDL